MSPEEAQLYPVSSQLASFIESRDAMRAVGTPLQVAKKINQLVEQFGVNEIMAVTNMYYFEDRKRSFELLQQAV